MQDQKHLTKRQKEVLNKILRFIAQNGYSPSYREVAKLLDTSNVSTAQYFVDELVKKGFLRKKSSGSGGIAPQTSPTTVPLLGIIAAGEPIEPIENPEEIVVPNSVLFNSRYPHYALSVKGDSMIDMGILDGDIILVKHQMTATPGDTVVAITEGGATLKVLKIENR